MDSKSKFWKIKKITQSQGNHLGFDAPNHGNLKIPGGAKA